MGEQHAVVVGGGIGGLATARALHQHGWRVTVVEQAPSLEPIGAGITLWPNALRALASLGLAEAVRARSAVVGFGGIRQPGGRWLTRADPAAAQTRYGLPLVALTRADLIELLTMDLPAGVLRLGDRVTGIDPGDEHRCPSVTMGDRQLSADVLVGADGVGSVVRRTLWPDHPGVRYAGYTTWRALVDQPDRAVGPTSETWGRGERFGVVPLADGQVYIYGCASAASGERARDELAEMVSRFGAWHDPIPELLARVDPAAILRHDVSDLAAPLPAFYRGRAVLLGDAAHAMEPNLGQGGCQSIEDAVTLAYNLRSARVPEALARYDTHRRPRTESMVVLARRLGWAAQWSSPVAVAARDLAVRLAPRALVMRTFDAAAGWHPSTN